MHNSGLENLLSNSLKISKTDKVSIIFEPERKEIAVAASELLGEKEISNKTLLVPDYDGKVLPSKLANEILSPDNNVVILFFVKSIWHHQERKEAKYKLRKRLVSYSGTLEMLESGPAAVSPEKMALLTNDLRDFFSDKIGKSIKITSEGTKLEAKISKVYYEDGLYDLPGSGGNFPAGEISFAFEETTAQGSIRANIKTKYLGIPKKGEEPGFEIEAGRLKNVKSATLLKLMEKHEELSWLAEIGFGICPDQTIQEEKDNITEEKIIGTAHVGLGSNVSFGGTRKGMHIDLVFGPATIEIGGDLLVSDGNLNQKFLSEKTKIGYKKFTKDDIF